MAGKMPKVMRPKVNMPKPKAMPKTMRGKGSK